MDGSSELLVSLNFLKNSTSKDWRIHSFVRQFFIAENKKLQIYNMCIYRMSLYFFIIIYSLDYF